MRIVAHGIDLIDCPRIKHMVERHDKRFLDRVYTKREQADAGKMNNRIERLAGRFAAKEAIVKLIGTGLRGKMAWTDIEIVNNHLGQPEVTLCKCVKETADKLGIKHISLSITHTADFAIASVVALTEDHEQ